MPNYPTDRESLERDCDLEFFIAGGPGGQHRNKVETGVRLTHRPSGVVVTATERRSQFDNREAAYERLAAKLEAMQRKRKKRVATQPTLGAKQRRLETKRQQSERKQFRSRKIEND
jgi:protein subunit release factor B